MRSLAVMPNLSWL